jgi:hypothetical protein
VHGPGPLPCMAAGLAVRTVFAQPDAASAWAQHARNSELAERVYRPEACACSRITSGPGSSRFPLWATVTPARRSIGPQPGTQEIASSHYRSVLVFVHLVKLAFTVGIESSFQILEISS